MIKRIRSAASSHSSSKASSLTSLHSLEDQDLDKEISNEESNEGIEITADQIPIDTEEVPDLT